MGPKIDLAAIENKLDIVLDKLEQLSTAQNNLQTSQNSLKAAFEACLPRIDTLEHQLTTVTENQGATSAHLGRHDRDINLLKISANNIEQLSRSNNIRIIGYPVLDDEVAAQHDGGIFLRQRVYDRLLKPLLSEAAKGGFFVSCPPPDVIVRVRRAGKPVVGSSPPPIVLTCGSSLVKQAIMRFKSSQLPAPNPVERTAGAKKFYVVEDLTKANHHILKLLQASESVAKVWSSDGQIRFVKVNSDTVHRVLDVFEPVEKILA